MSNPERFGQPEFDAALILGEPASPEQLRYLSYTVDSLLAAECQSIDESQVVAVSPHGTLIFNQSIHLQNGTIERDHIRMELKGENLDTLFVATFGPDNLFVPPFQALTDETRQQAADILKLVEIDRSFTDIERMALRSILEEAHKLEDRLTGTYISSNKDIHGLLALVFDPATNPNKVDASYTRSAHIAVNYDNGSVGTLEINEYTILADPSKIHDTGVGTADATELSINFPDPADSASSLQLTIAPDYTCTLEVLPGKTEQPAGFTAKQKQAAAKARQEALSAGLYTPTALDIERIIRLLQS